MPDPEEDVLLVLCAAVHVSSFADAIGAVEFAGSRKGKEPEGEAWLLDGKARKAMSLNKRQVCHFRHVGLKEGVFAVLLCASCGVVHV